MSEEQRGFMDDLWKQAFFSGTSCAEPHMLSEYDWNFSNLQDAFEEGGVLHGVEKVFVFGRAQPIMLRVNGQPKEIYVPVLVVIVSPFPPSDKIEIVSQQADSEEIIDMEKVNLGWVPYISLEEHDRASSLERPLPQIYILSCTQREDTSKFSELYPGFRYCLPYVDNPYKVDETEKNTVVDIVYPTEEGTIVHKYDWKYNTPEGFTNRLINAGLLSRDHEDSFKEFVTEKVKEGKRANREAEGEEFDELEELRRTEARVAAFEKMRFYKFFPVAKRGVPKLRRVKSAYINRHYGRAHQVL